MVANGWYQWVGEVGRNSGGLIEKSSVRGGQNLCRDGESIG